MTNPNSETVQQFHDVKVEGEEEEIIPAEWIAESEAAWQDYLEGRDPGISLEELEIELFGKQLD